jgi:SAM-dependent methyltransferase
LAVIAPTIILAVHDPDDAPAAPDARALADFYERAYSQDEQHAALYSRWRALGAGGKADHVLALCARAGLRPDSALEVGCGDGALLSELRARGLARRLVGVEIAPAAVAIARARPEIDVVDLYDGTRLSFAADEFDLGILSHVLEHVTDPSALLREVGRVCPVVVFEVPLEDNWSARRDVKREHAAEVGHLRRLDRAHARAIATDAGLLVTAELEDALPLRAQTFFARSPAARAAATAKWALRSGAHRLAPPLARRAFTVHYACLCRRPAA